MEKFVLAIYAAVGIYLAVTVASDEAIGMSEFRASAEAADSQVFSNAVALYTDADQLRWDKLTSCIQKAGPASGYADMTVVLDARSPRTVDIDCAAAHEAERRVDSTLDGAHRKRVERTLDQVAAITRDHPGGSAVVSSVLYPGR
jgi:hypothetical protein